MIVFYFWRFLVCMGWGYEIRIFEEFFGDLDFYVDLEIIKFFSNRIVNLVLFLILVIY